MVCGQAVHMVVSCMQCTYFGIEGILLREQLADIMSMRQLASSGCQFAPVLVYTHNPTKLSSKKWI